MIADVEFRLPVEPVDTIDDAIRPVDSDALRAIMQEIRVTSLSPVRLELPVDELPEDLAVGLRLELIGGDRVVPLGRLQYLHWNFNDRDRAYAFRADEDLQWTLDRETAGLLVRISGDGEMALRDLERDAYWSGEVVVPVLP